jgi:hypothetical protein
MGGGCLPLVGLTGGAPKNQRNIRARDPCWSILDPCGQRQPEALLLHPLASPKPGTHRDSMHSAPHHGCSARRRPKRLRRESSRKTFLESIRRARAPEDEICGVFAFLGGAAEGKPGPGRTKLDARTAPDRICNERDGASNLKLRRGVGGRKYR